MGGLNSPSSHTGAQDPDVTAAWIVLGNAGYNHDGPVLVRSPPRGAAWVGFVGNRAGKALCIDWQAWGSLIATAPRVQTPMPEPFRYDLVDIGREVLSQLTIPVAVTSPERPAKKKKRPQPGAAQHYRPAVRRLAARSGRATSHRSGRAFLLGSWLKRARRLGGNATDCTGTVLGARLSNCRDFMEWNARAQITTWHPVDSPAHPHVETGGSAMPWPGHISDYAGKWAGLVGGYYAVRISDFYLDVGMAAAASGEPISMVAVTRCQAALAYNWQTDWVDDKYPSEPVGEPVAVSKALKYAPYFATCGD